MKRKNITHHEHLLIDRDMQEAAKAAKLVYLPDSVEGILRQKKGRKLFYTYQGKSLKNDQLERIRKLAIPPSWSNVWISPNATGHLQATGTDLLGRKQYRYHANWNQLRNETKFHRLYEFGKALPGIRAKVKKDMGGDQLNNNKVLATAIHLMEQTYIRVGNNEYEKKYGSHGLTTLKDKHVNVGREKLVFTFKGKKGIEHNITIRNKKLARIVKECRDIPGKELFQFYTDTGEKKAIDSGMVNNYIKEASQHDFSAKDFRTWAGTLKALQCICLLKDADDDKEVRQNMLKVLDEVSSKLGNTRNICKKYYVHPGLFKLYEQKEILKYINPRKITGKKDKNFSPDEHLLMTLLKKCA